MASSYQNFDIIIIGGGIVGLTLACALAPTGVKVAIIEKMDPSAVQDKEFDGRVLALAHDSKEVFKNIGVWDIILNSSDSGIKQPSGDIRDIRVVDDSAPSLLHFNGLEVSDEPLGHVVEIRFIRKALFKSIEKYKNIHLIAPVAKTDIQYTNEFVYVEIDSGMKIKSKLLIGADGRFSNIRKQAGIHTTKTSYNQSAITFVVKHEKNHNNLAVENFLPAGPFAILPMGGGYHSSVVWTEDKDLVPLFMDMGEEEFLTHLEERFGSHLGKIELASKRWFYPLSLVFSDTYIAHRMCLVGDAAHGIHPISGQGFNLGIRDVAFLADLIAETHRLGLDIGSAGMLGKYERLRKSDNLKMIAATDGLNRLFSNNITPLKAARRMGLRFVQKQPTLKKLFMKHAMGHINQQSPKIIRGDRL